MVSETKGLLVVLGALAEEAPPGPGACNEVYQQVLDNTPQYNALHYATSAGVIQCTSLPAAQGVGIADRPYFQSAIQTRSFVMSPAVISRATGESLIVFALPVIGRNDAVQGIVITTVSLSRLKVVGPNANLPPQATATILDSDGTVLFHWPDDGSFVGRALPDNSSLRPLLTSQQEGVMEGTGLDGVQRVQAFERVRLPAGQSWLVTVSTPTAVAYAQAEATAVRSLATLFLVLSVGLGGVLWSSHRLMVRPLERLLSAINQVRWGDLSARADVSAGPIEVRSLADGFNRMTADLEAVNAGLEQQVEERTEALAVANAQLHAALRTRETFTAKMSHELRTPLTAIIGFSDLLADEARYQVTAEKRKLFLGHIRASGQHLLNLINDLLDLAKIEAARMELVREVIPARRALEGALEMLAPAAAAKGVTLTIAPGYEGPLDADPNKLRQMLYNLLSNAIKFTPAGGSVTLQAVTTEDEVRLSVTDTGTGIPQALQAAVFESFRQLPSDQENDTPGTGLGLTITKNLAELHGGRVELQSAAGAGSSFTIVLPLHRRDLAETLPNAPLVLVVENDANASEVLSTYLARGGYRPVPVFASAEVVRLAQAQHPWAITLDILMPGVDGWGVLRALKANADTSAIPVIIISVLDERGVGFGLGAAGYLVKPVVPGDLMALLDQLRQRPAGSPPQAMPP